MDFLELKKRIKRGDTVFKLDGERFLLESHCIAGAGRFSLFFKSLKGEEKVLVDQWSFVRRRIEACRQAMD